MIFPDFSDNEELAEWVGVLADQQGYYIGLIKSGNVNESDLTKFRVFKDRLYKITVSSNDGVNKLVYNKDYAKVLEDLIAAAIK